jgi:hypothetical protein
LSTGHGLEIARMTNRTLVSTALGVLREPGIWKIGFDLNGLCVTGQRYAMVAAAIEDGKIACEAVDRFPLKPGQKLPPGTKIGAVYDPDADTIYFPREDYGKSSGYEKTVILHEATHAIFDLFAKTGDDRVLAINDEAAAVLAQAHYLRLCAPNDSQAIHRFSMMIDGPGELALKLVDKMMDDTGDFMKDRRTYFLRPEQTSKLRAAVATEWGLIRETQPDGTISDRTGELSIYNGVVTCYACWVQGRRPSTR